jgi:general secretion pathway protein E
MNNMMINYDISKNISLEYLINNCTLPIDIHTLYVQVVAINEDTRSYFESLYNLPVKFIFKSSKEILYMLDNLEIKRSIYNIYCKALQASIDDDKSYIIELLDKLIYFAILKKSSDIHIETLKDKMILRYRIDGYLEEVFVFKLELLNMLSSIIKLLSQLDISQKRIPQDGRFSKQINNNSYDFRVSILPTIIGESIVLRILDNNIKTLDLNGLGMSIDNLNLVKKSIKNTSGMILVTGPTGSGKTTTLYSILSTLNIESKKIITVEDPVEYNIANIQQVNINNDIGLGFTDVLKNILRQDPDIIMIGEIRDKKSLQIAMQAALTGHLVLATLHTNNAISTISRLIDLEAPRYLIASTLKTIVSQRLIRKLCNKCKQTTILDGKTIYKQIGCNYCNTKGYISREIISEVLDIDDNVASLILRQASDNEIYEYVKNVNFKSLYDDGLYKIDQGLTTPEELYSIVVCQ